MGENDRLQREMALVCAKFDEESKRSESARSALESLRESKENLLAMHETDETLLVRKDRKIEELKEELESERLQREHAESETKETRIERDTIVQKLTKESLDDKELAKRSTAQYEVLSRSWKGLEDKYDRQAQTLRHSIQTLQGELTESKQRLARIDLIMEQLKQEGEKIRRSRDNMARDFELYKQQQEEGLVGMKETAQRNNEVNERLFSDVTTVLGEMKYVMNLKKDVKSLGNEGWSSSRASLPGPAYIVLVLHHAYYIMHTTSCTVSGGNARVLWYRVGNNNIFYMIPFLIPFLTAL